MLSAVAALPARSSGRVSGLWGKVKLRRMLQARKSVPKLPLWNA
jgi:hypothetical protein